MVYNHIQILALIRLFLFHTKTVYTVREMRDLVSKGNILFDTDEINAEISANDLAEIMG